MLTALSSLYFIYGFILFYTYTKGYSLLRYLLKRKNINTQLSIEFLFIIFTSLVVFTSQPTNWIVGLIMLFHVGGVVWIISNPDSYYSMAEDPSIDIDSLEFATSIIVIGMGIFVYFSKIIQIKSLSLLYRLDVSHFPSPFF